MLGFAVLGLLGLGLVFSLGGDDDDDSNDVRDDVPGDVSGDTTSTNGDDFLEFGSGNDAVSAAGGDDFVNAGAGNDTVDGGSGDDLILGGDGNDVLNGQAGDDLIFAGAGADLVDGGTGNDSISGADILDAEGALNAAFAVGLAGGTADDVDQGAFIDLNADPGEADTLIGGDGNDAIIAGSNDVVDTGTGSDVVNVGTWVERGSPVTVTDFDPERDTVVYSFEGLPPNEIGFGTQDGIASLIVDQRTVATFEGLSAEDLTAATQIALEPLDFDESAGDLATGTLGEDRFIGTNGNDFFDAGEGNDLVEGRAGDDTVAGGAGDDVVQGQGGDDFINGQTGDDFIQGRGDNDTIRGEAGDDWVAGDDGNDSVTGQEGDDTVIGGAGEDTLAGGSDDDLLIGGTVLGAPFSNAELTVLRSGTVTLGQLLGVAPGGSVTLTDDNAVDVLDGRNEDDALIFGAGDIATGGLGADDFLVLADSAGNSAGLSVITDFVPTDDSVFVMREAGVTGPADIAVNTDGDDAVILIDGVETTRVLGAAGDLTAGDIFVVSGINVDFLNPA